MKLWTSKRMALRALYDVVFRIHVEQPGRGGPENELEREMLDHFYSLCEVAGYREGPWNASSGSRTTAEKAVGGS